MKIIVAGTGYVGLVHATVCSEYGHDVYAYDIDKDRIDAYASGEAKRIEQYINEPGLSNLIKETVDKTLFFTTDLNSIIEGTDVIFLCLPTPSKADGSSNLTYYDAAAEDFAQLLAKRQDKRRVVMVNKSTVPIGTSRHLEIIMKRHNVENFGVASNPEFLAEGTAITQARKPDRVVVGCDREADFKILRRVYSQFVNHVRIQYIETTPETAEAIKYVANTMLLTYISFWNGVGARLGEKISNVKIEDLRRGVTSDDRISTWGSYVSNGAGGSCFGKDIRSLIYQLRRVDVNAKLLESTYEVNEYQKVYLVERAISEADFRFNNKTISLLGLAFKKQTNDIRDSSAIKVAETLLGKGVSKIKAYDPLATDEAKKFFGVSKNILFEKIEYYDTAQDAIENSDALFISTDWEEFRGLSDTIVKTVKPPYLIIDGRRMIPDYNDLVEKGYTYLAVGSGVLKPKKTKDYS
jgi:UDPglucose 6-dehydrogenase